MITRKTREIVRKIGAGLMLSFMALFALSFAQQVFAEVNTTDYVSLTTIPGFTEAGQSTNPIEKITNIYGVSIGIAAVLAVVMIIIAGLKYATTEAIDGKSDAKDTWHGAVYGLGLLLASFLLLRTINIDLVNVDLSLGKPQIADGTLLVGGGDLTSALEKVENNSNKILAALETQNQALSEAEKNLADARKTGNADQIAAAEKILVETKQQASQVTEKLNKETNAIIDQSVLAARSFIPAGVEKSLKGEFTKKVNEIDAVLDKSIADLERQKASATTDSEKELISKSIVSLSEKKTMTDIALEASWRTASNLKYSAGQTDSLSAFQQVLINQKNSTLAKITNKNSADAINFQKDMNSMILKVGNAMSSPGN